jgi:ABC-type transporter MlaC component
LGGILLDILRLRIVALQEQLGNLGYQSFQVNSMIKEILGTTSVKDATREQQEQLIEALETSLAFAQKCRQHL